MKNIGKRLGCLLTIITVVGAGVGCANTPKNGGSLLTDVDLVWKPTDNIDELKKIEAEKLRSISIVGVELTDARKVQPTNLVGENKESEKAYPVTTRSDIAKFVSTNLADTLTRAGVDANSGKGKFSLRGEIREFKVEESPSYHGIVTVHLELLKQGSVVWQGTLSGTNSRFGRSYKLENYLQGLSDSIMDLTGQILRSSSLAAKLE